MRENTKNNLLPLTRASEVVTTAVLLAAGKVIDLEMASDSASVFFSTGIPVYDAFAVFLSSPFSLWRPNTLERPTRDSFTVNLYDFLVAVIHRRSLANLTGLPEQEVEQWETVASLWFFDSMTKLSAKVVRKKESPAERNSFGYGLVGLLLICELRTTHVLQALTGSLGEDGVQAADVLRGMRALIYCVVDWSDQRQQLKLWARHWLRKLYGDTEESDAKIVRQAAPILFFCALLCSMSLDPGGLIEVDLGRQVWGLDSCADRRRNRQMWRVDR